MGTEICPVCSGAGNVPCIGPGTNPAAICHGCNGKGWVETYNESGNTLKYIPQETTDCKMGTDLCL